MPGPWLYVDDRRTHEVRVQHPQGRALELVFRESELGGKDDKEVWTRTVQLTEPWERQMHLLALERRLTLLGNYFRTEAGRPGWTPVRQPTSVRALDLRPTKGRGEIEFHVYREEERDRTRTFVVLTQDTPKGPRSLLGRFDAFGKGREAAGVQILHVGLPPPVCRSLLASEVLVALDDRMRRGEPPQRDGSWWGDVLELVEGLLSAVQVGEVKQGEWRPTWKGDKPVSAAQQRALDIGGARAFDVEDEDTGTARNVEGKKASVRIDEIPDDVFGILRDPRLLALHERFLAPGEKELLVHKSERELLAALKKKRDAVRPDEWHLLSVVEASLLVQRALSVKGARLERETLHVLRHAPAYL